MLASVLPAAAMSMSMGHEPAVDLHNLLLDWQWSPFSIGVMVALLASAGWYVTAVDRLDARGTHWSSWRTVSWIAGLFTIALALCSSVATYTNYTFVAHVMQHLLLMVIAPPLLALAAPMTLILQTTRRSWKSLVLKALHSRVFAVIRNPVPVFFLYYLSMYAFFLSPAIGYAMTHMWIMDLINLGFLGGATLFWWPMVGVDPIPGGRMHSGLKIINLLIGIPIESFLGIAIMTDRAPVAPIYTLASSHAGGGVLWALSEAATVLAVVPIYIEWVRSDKRAARRIDARLDAGLGLEPPAPAGVGLSATLRSLRRG